MSNFVSLVYRDKVKNLRPRCIVPPEFRGYYDLLEAALFQSARDYAEKDRYLRERAKTYFAGRTPGIFAFDSVCKYLSLNRRLFFDILNRRWTNGQGKVRHTMSSNIR